MKYNRNIIDEDLEKIYNSSINWVNFFNKTVLISGASGFLPAYLVESLLFVNKKYSKANIKVIALVRNEDNAKKRFLHYKESKDLIILVQDVCEEIIINTKIDFIIHAASQASPKYYGIDPVGTINANVIGTTNLLKLGKLNNIQGFLYFSSSEVYGDLPNSMIPTSEDNFGFINPVNIRSCYSEGKRAGETICVSWHHQFKIPIFIVRPFHTYGPGMSLNDGRVYADFVRDIVDCKNIEMKSDGKAIRAFCYISDATIAFLKVLTEGEVGNAYNIGNDNCVTSIIELAEKLVKIFPERNLNVVKVKQENTTYINSSISKNIPNISKIKKLNWNPEIEITEGFKRTIRFYI